MADPADDCSGHTLVLPPVGLASENPPEYDTTMSIDRITIDPAVCSGKPCIRGLRFPVHQIVELVAAGNSWQEIVDDFPALEEEDIRQALTYAARLARDEWAAA
jgi:uncharacterized protein (DUF433 family)